MKFGKSIHLAFAAALVALALLSPQAAYAAGDLTVQRLQPGGTSFEPATDADASAVDASSEDDLAQAEDEASGGATSDDADDGVAIEIPIRIKHAP